MPARDLTELVDVIVADLEANVDLPRHRVWKYVEPPVIRPDLGPMIAVYPTVSSYDLISTTASYEQGDLVAVVWYAPTIESVETGGTGSQNAAKAALEIAETIISRLRTYASNLPGLDGQEEIIVKRVEYEMLPGGYWTSTMYVDVTRWPAN
jgi:hypothetical protein